MNKISRIIFVCFLFLTTCSFSGTRVFAAEPHQDPDTARIAFSGIALFRYYSGSLDYVISRDPDEVETRLRKMPFANVPEEIEDLVDEFAVSVTDISGNTVEILANINELQSYIETSRLEEALDLVGRLLPDLWEVKNQVQQIKGNVQNTGIEMDVFSVPETSVLRQSYEEVQQKLDTILEILSLYEKLITNLLASIEVLDYEVQDMNFEEISDLDFMEFLESLDITLLEQLTQTQITLEVDPLNPFVGDTVSFQGRLTYGNRPLASREVDIVIGGSKSITLRTDGSGYFRGTYQVPYHYVHTLEMQSVFYPGINDTGIYLAALSEPVILNVQFYETDLRITVEKNVYPGKSTTVQGMLDYSSNPVPDERDAKIFLDDTLVAELTTEERFTETLFIKSNIVGGKHYLLVLVDSQGRYAPAAASAVLNIHRIIPQLELNVPRLSMIPGRFLISGRVYSDLGTVSNARVVIKVGKSSKTILTSKDGTFSTGMAIGITFGLVGEQDIIVQVFPAEPWHNPFHASRSLLLINLLSGAMVIVVLILVSLYLPGRIRRSLGRYIARPRKVPVPVVDPDLGPEYSLATTSPVSPAENEEPHRGPRETILHWYLTVIRMVQQVTRLFIKPHQTLREFAAETGAIIGPAARFLMGFTRMVERLLYSRYVPTTVDVTNSEQYFRQLGGDLGLQVAGEETPSGLEGISDTENPEPSVPGEPADSDEPLPEKNRRRWRLVWLIIPLVIAVIIIAFIIFLLPLLGVSLSFLLPLVITGDPEADTTGNKTDYRRGARR